MPDVDITMHTLHVRDHQEGGSIFVPSGDEPYFIAVGFRSAFRSAGSTQTFTNAYRNAKWAAGIKRGQSRDIPSGMGNITFRNVRLRSERDILAGQLPEIIGAVVVAMESDATPWPLIDALVGQIRTATHTEIKGLIESAPMGIPSHEAISGAVRNVFKAMDLRVWQKIGLWMGSWTDPDDPIGYHLFVMPAIDASAERLVKLPANTPGTAVRVQPFSTSIVFIGDGAHYEVQAAVRLTQPNWRYCRKCQALFYDGMNEKGVCVGRGAHEAAGYNFRIPYGKAANGQEHWRFCRRCFTMFYNGYPQKGVCARGGSHEAAGFGYVVAHDRPGPGQDGWRFCRKCQSMFYDGYPAKGACPTGRGHEMAGYNFRLDHWG